VKKYSGKGEARKMVAAKDYPVEYFAASALAGMNWSRLE
jgi:hypothetical protein